MRPTQPSSSSSHHSRPAMKPRPKLSREQLRKHLQIVGTLSTPLPSELPSPPASRSTSPSVPPAGSKRKLSQLKSVGEAKRARIDRPTESVASTSRQPALLPAKPEPAPAPQEALALTPSTSAIASAVSAPVQRPRKGKPATVQFARNHDKYREQGRALKYSGDARHFSSYPPQHKEFRALPNPPPEGTPYHIYGGGISRLEHVNGFVCFIYAMLCRDEQMRTCQMEAWQSFREYTSFCKEKFASSNVTTDRERAFLGLILMAESFIYGRMAQHLIQSKLKYDVKGIVGDVKRQIEDICTKGARAADTSTPATSIRSQPTPPMLPSPASMTTTNSANSTPTATATPPSAARPSLAAPPNSHAELIPLDMIPAGQVVPRAADSITTSVSPAQAQSISDLVNCLEKARETAIEAQKLLSLPVLARHFPHTFARVTQTSLGAHEEYEPDLDDDACELFWPGQLATGAGLGWVCLLGMAMVREFGKEYGYRGIDGVVPKPNEGRARPGGP